MTAALMLALLAAAPPAQPEDMLTQVDLAQPTRPQPGPGEAMIVLRPFATKMAGDNRILFYRLDPATGQPAISRNGKPAGARATFGAGLFGGPKNVRALRVLIVPAGDHVLAGRTFNLNYTDIFCFGAPRFTAAPGSVTYVGDFELRALEKMADGERRNAMPHDFRLEEARAALAAVYPQQAARLAAWRPVNGATFPCRGDEFLAYAVKPPIEPTPPLP